MTPRKTNLGALAMKGTPVVAPVYLTATYRFDKSDDLIDVVQHRSGYIYSRWDNPTVLAAEKMLADMEGYEHAVGFGSGMAAIATSVMAHVQAGGRIVATHEIYGGTYELFTDVLPKMGIEVVLVNCGDTDRLLAEIQSGLALLYLETPTNPLLRVVDVPPLVEAAHRQKAVVLLDSTFASPVNQHPVAWGVVITVHSATKYLGGHHDVTAGFACCSAKCFQAVWDYRKILGGVMDPMTAFLIQRGMRTLDLRIERQNQNALKIAEFLSRHHRVKAVHYPGLPSHPDHAVATRQMQGYGGMLSFELDADFEGTKQFMDRLARIKLATSLGGATSLANQPITNTHAGLSPESRAKAGVSESLVRLSVGIENVEHLIGDIDQALAKA